MHNTISEARSSFSTIEILVFNVENLLHRRMTAPRLNHQLNVEDSWDAYHHRHATCQINTNNKRIKHMTNAVENTAIQPSCTV